MSLARDLCPFIPAILRHPDLYLRSASIAWPVPGGRIAAYFEARVYLTGRLDWRVVAKEELEGWTPGEFGELRPPRRRRDATAHQP